MKEKLKLKNKEKLKLKDLSIDGIKKELNNEKYKSKYKKLLLSSIYTLIIVISISIILATIFIPVLTISGSSMDPILNEGEIVLTINTKKINNGDIIAFYYGNKILVKRVIASPNSWVNITLDGDVYINDVLLDEPYIKNKSIGDTDIEYPYQVLDNSYFVLGDDRTTSVDSRNSIIGTVNKDDIIGKVVFRIWPLKKIGKIN